VIIQMRQLPFYSVVVFFALNLNSVIVNVVTSFTIERIDNVDKT